MLKSNCGVGSGNIFTISFVSDDGHTSLNCTTLPQPAASGNFTIDYHYPSTPYPATNMQITMVDNVLFQTFTAQSGTAAVTVLGGNIKVSFNKVSFIHSTTTKVISATVVCQ